MRDNPQLIATLIIWLAFTVIMAIIFGVLAATNPQLEWWGAGMIFSIVMTLIIAVTSSTGSIWGSRRERYEQLNHAKAKRTASDRIERLVEALNDDEVYELEALLMAREDKTAHQDKS